MRSGRRLGWHRPLRGVRRRRGNPCGTVTSPGERTWPTTLITRFSLVFDACGTCARAAGSGGATSAAGERPKMAKPPAMTAAAASKARAKIIPRRPRKPGRPVEPGSQRRARRCSVCSGSQLRTSLPPGNGLSGGVGLSASADRRALRPGGRTSGAPSADGPPSSGELSADSPAFEPAVRECGIAPSAPADGREFGSHSVPVGGWLPAVAAALPRLRADRPARPRGSQRRATRCRVRRGAERRPAGRPAR